MKQQSDIPMLSFASFITESLDVEKLKHLEHAEDHIIHGGHEGVKHAADTLENVHNILTGKKSSAKITTKYDGAPSIVFGINPENNRFFVATKSAFNKTPKLNYTAKDIDENHGQSPGLVEKLRVALKELPNIMPKDGGVYQGDVMYTKGDVEDSGKQYSFTPNTITYTADKDSHHGRRIGAAKIGVVVHTKYSGARGHHARLADMKAGFDVNHNKFQTDPNVHMINPEIKDAKISGIDNKKYQKHITDATQLYSKMDPEAFDSALTNEHQTLIKRYINKCVANDDVPSVKGYQQYIDTVGKKDIEKLKTQSGKDKKQEALDSKLDHIKQHKDHFEQILRLHSNIQKAKDVLTSALASSVDTGFKTTIGGKETKPEGFVAIHGGRPTKLVDRAEFSRSNFLTGQFNKANEQKPEDRPTSPVVMSFGRMNPPTAGHQVLVNKVEELAKENNAPHHVILSATHDPEKNPLTQQQKLKHAKRAFPTANIKGATEDAPGILDHVKDLARNKHDHLIYVAGSDRVEDMKRLLDSRNGKDYFFKKIDVVSAGHRDPDAEGTEGMSGTKLRSHALGNRFSEFRKGVSTHMHPEHAKELFNDVKRGMDIKIDSTTSGISLGKYAKRDDVIGVRARKEQERRAALKQQGAK